LDRRSSTWREPPWLVAALSIAVQAVRTSFDPVRPAIFSAVIRNGERCTRRSAPYGRIGVARFEDVEIPCSYLDADLPAIP